MLSIDRRFRRRRLRDVVFLFLLGCSSSPQSLALSGFTPRTVHAVKRLRFLHRATSSSDLKDESSDNDAPTTKSKYGKDSVVTRLKRAASRASASAANKNKVATEQASKLQQEHLPKKKPLASLRQLTAVIDQQLQQSKAPSRLVTIQQNPDSMGAIFLHNTRHRPATTRHIAILLAKPTQDDRITVEGAGRVRLLVDALRQGYQPDWICFVGGTSGDNQVADADAAYIFFRHLCSSQQIPCRIPIRIERSPVDQALQQFVQFIQQSAIPQWWEDVLVQDSSNSETDTTTPRRRKLQLHCSILSSEYQLCQLNDIHTRSPNQSALRVFSQLRNNVEASWSFNYTTTATAIMDPVRSFAAKTYKTAQGLVPVLYNLKGVTENNEFFQRDNYRVLVAARRSLVADMESMYHKQPSLRSVHQILSDGSPLDVVLESALLSLGRCLDLVRPAGLLVGSVASDDFKRALASLQQAYYLLDRACDPDEPLDPRDWGKLDKGSKAQVLDDEEVDFWSPELD